MSVQIKRTLMVLFTIDSSHARQRTLFPKPRKDLD